MRMWQHVITVLLITVESSSAQCTLSYDQRPGMTVSGSQTQGSITSREGCEAACQANADCVGYDWTTANQCRLALGIPDTPTTSDPESTHYRRIETCVSGASTCTYEYIGQYTISPSDRNGPVLTGDCGGECNTNDGCAGYVRDVNECLLSFTTETADRMSSSTHGMYNKTTCGPAQAAPVCDPITFTMFADFHVSGGVADSNGDGNVVICQTICVGDSACVGVDFTDSGSCYITIDPDTAITLDSTTTHYQAHRICTTGANVCGYDQYGAFVPTAGQTTTASQTFDQCIALCNNDGGCTQVAYDASTSFCVTSFGTAAQKTGNAAYHMLRKQSTCPVAPTVSTAPSTVAQTVSTAPSTAPVTTTPFGPVCEDPVWTTLVGFSSLGGSPRDGISTVVTCQQQCIDDAACSAIDFEATALPPCWLHLSAAYADPVNFRTRSGVTQYILVERCPQVTVPSTAVLTSTKIPPSFTTSAGGSTTQVCDNVFTTNGGKHSHGAAEQVGFTNLQDCQDGCVASADCVAIDSSVRPFSCWFHLDAANLATTETRTGVNQYVLTRCTTPDCPKFEEFVGMRVAGGIPQADIGSLAECRAACDVANDCHGIDYANRATGAKCFLHTTANTRTELEPETGVTHYAMICKTGESLPTGPGDTTTVTTESTTVQACTAGFIETINQHALTSDAPYTEITSATICLQLCARYPRQCYGANYDRVARTCSLVLVEIYTAQTRNTNSLFRAILCS